MDEIVDVKTSAFATSMSLRSIRWLCPYSLFDPFRFSTISMFLLVFGN
jgi:hypothetical protein